VYQVTSAVERYVAVYKHGNFQNCNWNWHAIVLTFVSSALSYGINESFAVHSPHEFMLAAEAIGLEGVTRTKPFNLTGHQARTKSPRACRNTAMMLSTVPMPRGLYLVKL
jgi:hypothetical protein